MPETQSPNRPPASERDLVRRAAELVAERLPQTWKSELREGGSSGGRQADAVLTVEAPDGNRALVVIEAKRTLETRDAIPLAEQLKCSQRRTHRGGGRRDWPAHGALHRSCRARRLTERGVVTPTRPET